MAKTWMVIVGILLIVIFIIPMILLLNLVLQLNTLSRSFQSMVIGAFGFSLLMIVIGIILIFLGYKRQ
ncbi:MAG: hypothetical protein EU539_11505 [Promethearchaeota archaeon]|nr:MAG: hypothetical protein EU539_11505 [Candidatus Lokiarchaeota archaeon]